jgi:hypothetical protein
VIAAATPLQRDTKLNTGEVSFSGVCIFDTDDHSAAVRAAASGS